MWPLNHSSPNIPTTINSIFFSSSIDEPRIVNPPILAKSASDEGSVGRLVCQAQGAPNITFQWIHEGSIISAEGSAKYLVEPTVNLDLITYQSVLKIKSVSSSDYGSYDCVARNELGFTRYTMNFNRTSKPDTPLAVRVTNRTSSTVSLRWIPGFNGGLDQYFRIRYQKFDGASSEGESASPLVSTTLVHSSSQAFMYSDVYPKNATRFTVSGLDDDEEYIFSLMAYNALGESKYSEDLVKVKTLKGTNCSAVLVKTLTCTTN